VQEALQESFSLVTFLLFYFWLPRINNTKRLFPVADGNAALRGSGIFTLLLAAGKSD
jgi:hypothetical protein